MDEFEGPWRAAAPPPAPARKRPSTRLFLWLALMAGGLAVFVLLARLFPGQLSGDDWAQALGLFALLAIVSRGILAARRLDFAATARGIAIWVALFAVGLVGYVFRDDITAGALRVRSALIPAYAVADTPQSMVVGRAEDGAFYVMGTLNGTPVRFLIDTGASDIVLSPADAQRAGLALALLRFSRPSETAGGVAFGAAATARELTVGSIRLADVPVLVNQNPMNFSLLGMPFLRRFSSVEVRGDQLFLRGRR